MMITVSKDFRFDAAHHLPNYDGPCKRLHGHTYKLRVTVKGEIQKEGPHQGMIIDFGILKRIVNERVINRYDHQNLNELFDNPTAEEMAKKIWITLKHCFSDISHVQIQEIKLWETPDSFTTITREKGDGLHS